MGESSKCFSIKDLGLFYKIDCEIGVHTHFLIVKIDRSKSGNVNFNKRFSSIESVKISSGDLDLKSLILIDKSIAEVFINNGEHVLTDLVFPTKENGAIED